MQQQISIFFPGATRTIFPIAAPTLIRLIGSPLLRTIFPKTIHHKIIFIRGALDQPAIARPLSPLPDIEGGGAAEWSGPAAFGPASSA